MERKSWKSSGANVEPCPSWTRYQSQIAPHTT
jgi:hypothetical protein